MKGVKGGVSCEGTFLMPDGRELIVGINCGPGSAARCIANVQNTGAINGGTQVGGIHCQLVNHA